MKYFILNAPIYSGKAGIWVMVKSLHKQDDSTVTVEGFNDLILSVQPSGIWEWRPLGTAGNYERATLNGSIIVFDPSTQAPFAYPILSSVV
ncbi:MAG: hypothetical protein EPO09_21835 [Aquabacterium sp.]|uniref:hypothetical protein n=1 Tax=Aquabacterium sp. TaxID=1872578 RepID=UPI00121566D3|nr:hypothetical protein [Aquabacterium sp.]TAK81831.1 MAG: hypothetical protein EPO09_21835 [Aquabacterium sp.]